MVFKQLLYCLLGCLLLFACKQGTSFEYDKTLLAKSHYLYIIEEGESMMGLMNEKGKFVVPLQDISIEKLDKDGQFFLIEKQLFSIKYGLNDKEFDHFYLREFMQFRDSSYFLAVSDSSSFLVNELGETVLKTTKTWNRINNWNDQYYSLEQQNRIAFFDSNHQPVFEIDSVYTFNTKQVLNAPDLFLFSKISDKINQHQLINIQTKKTLDLKGIFRNYVFSGYEELLNSYWNAGIDSFPYPVVSKMVLDSIFQDYTKSYDRSFYALKIFKFYNLDLEPISERLYSWDEVYAPYNPNGQVVRDYAKKAYWLIPHDTSQAPLETFTYLETGYSANLQNWFIGRDKNKAQVALFKGMPIHRTKLGNIRLINDNYFAVRKNDSIQELRDSLGNIIIPFGKQSFESIQQDNEQTYVYANFIQITKADSIFLFNPKNKNIQFITTNENSRYSKITQVYPYIFTLNDAIIYNAKTNRILLDYTVSKDANRSRLPFFKLRDIHIGLIKKGIICYRLQGFYLKAGNLNTETVYRLMGMDGKEIVDYDFSEYGSFSKERYKPYELIAAQPYSENPYQNHSHLFHQDMQRFWPKDDVENQRVDFIQDKQSLKAKLANEGIPLIEMTLSEFNSLNWFELLLGKMENNPFGIAASLSFEIIHVKQDLSFNTISNALSSAPFLEFDIKELKDLAEGDLVLFNNIHPEGTYGDAAAPPNPLIAITLK